MKHSLHGLIAATHTPFTSSGDLNLAAVEKQAGHMLANKLTGVFIGGTTGESSSLTLAERQALATRWHEVARGTPLKIVVHVGSNCLADARTLARQAQELGATAISALSPSYFKPRTVDLLVDCMAEIAAAAPSTPFYFYDIPPFTGVQLSMPEFLEKARDRIPTLVGLKFTNGDLMAFQQCLRAGGGPWDLLFGFDELLLAALALGAKGAVGSTYNFAAPIYLRVIAAVERGDLAAARTEQYKSVQLVQLLVSYGFMGAAKAVMGMLGVPVGPARLPNGNLSAADVSRLRGELETVGFFEWIKA